MWDQNTLTWTDEVRDTEVDLQGIVGNSYYLIYMQHARHKYLKQIGLDVTQMHNVGIDLMLIRTEIDFKNSLKSGDQYMVSSQLQAEGRIKFAFIQKILRLPDQTEMAIAKNIGVCIDRKNNKPIIPEEFKVILSVKSSDQ